MYSNNNAMRRVKRGIEMLQPATDGTKLSASVRQHGVFGVSAIVNAAQLKLNMNTEPGLIQSNHGKRTTSVRLEHLDILEQIVRDFGFKDRSHFFQLCTDALLQAHKDGRRLDWPPRFVVRD
jgi:hypothetical protein